MKIVFTFICALFFIGMTAAQNEESKLLDAWRNTQLQDSTRFKAMGELIQVHYLFKQTDKALTLAYQMLDLAKVIKILKYEIEANTLIARVHFELNEIEKGEEVYNKGLELAKTSKDSSLYAEKLFDFAYMYSKYEEYTKAFKTFQQSEKLYSKLGDRVNEGWSIVHQGFIYRNLGDYKESEKYHLKHLQLSQKYDIKKSISAAYGNLGEIYHKLGNLPKSIDHWKTAIRLSKEINLAEYANVGTGKLVEIYISEKQFEEAIFYLNEYIAIANTVDIPKYERSFELNIHLWQCQIDYGLQNYSKALIECEDCLTIYNVNNWNPESSILKSLYEVNKELNRPAIALNYLEKFQMATDDEKEDRARSEIQSIVFNNQILADSIAQAQEKAMLNIAYGERLRKKNQERNLFILIGVLVVLLAITYFITSRRLATAERKRHNEITQLKNALFTNITHEFRTPLTVIKGMTDAIKTNLKNKQDHDFENSLEIIDRNSNGLLQLINEMLDLAKIESGNMALNMVQINIIPFVKYLSQSFQSLAEEKQINFTVNCDLDMVEMDIDVNKFTAIITNLLSNAIKFTSKQGQVRVDIDKVKLNATGYLQIKVTDSGLGISNEELAHIFDKFYQVDNSSYKHQKGTGIGLALVKDFVELMDGLINVESQLGKSSVFTIKIPITNTADPLSGLELETNASILKAAVTSPSAQTDNLYHNNQSNLPLILIIEDNIDVTHYIKTCLIEHYQILNATDGAIGIDMALEKIPDLVISDVMMPEKDGFEVCEHLKNNELTNHIPIIMLTAKATFEDKLTGLKHGADAYLTKPFEKAELLTRIDHLILLRKNMLSKFEKTGIERLLSKNIKNSKTKFLDKIITLIHDHMTNPDFGPVQLAQNLNLSESQLYRKLKATSGKSTALFIRTIRLQKAKEILQTTDKTISDIAYGVGFNDPSYFSRAFKEEFGKPPSTFAS